MHSLPTACALLLLLSSSATYAQSKHPASSSSKGVGTRALGQYDEYLHARITTWYDDCLKGWNATSHMSERNYERTCLQMARERVKFLDDEAKGRMRAK
jgi:hypothetical protein